VIGYKAKGADFGGTTTIEAFAAKFKGPLILVGPDAADAFYVNEYAEKRINDLMIPDGKWKRIGA